LVHGFEERTDPNAPNVKHDMLYKKVLQVRKTPQKWGFHGDFAVHVLTTTTTTATSITIITIITIITVITISS
jgi:hypothetical protein